MTTKQKQKLESRLQRHFPHLPEAPKQAINLFDRWNAASFAASRIAFDQPTEIPMCCLEAAVDYFLAGMKPHNLEWVRDAYLVTIREHLVKL